RTRRKFVVVPVGKWPAAQRVVPPTGCGRCLELRGTGCPRVGFLHMLFFRGRRTRGTRVPGAVLRSGAFGPCPLRGQWYLGAGGDVGILTAGTLLTRGVRNGTLFPRYPGRWLTSLRARPRVGDSPVGGCLQVR